MLRFLAGAAKHQESFVDRLRHDFLRATAAEVEATSERWSRENDAGMHFGALDCTRLLRWDRARLRRAV